MELHNTKFCQLFFAERPYGAAVPVWYVDWVHCWPGTTQAEGKSFLLLSQKIRVLHCICLYVTTTFVFANILLLEDGSRISLNILRNMVYAREADYGADACNFNFLVRMRSSATSRCRAGASEERPYGQDRRGSGAKSCAGWRRRRLRVEILQAGLATIHVYIAPKFALGGISSYKNKIHQT